MIRPLACLAVLIGLAAPALAAPVNVRITNQSVPTLCAEEDNVDLRLTSETVRRFRIEAVHPSVIGTIVQDTTAPDFTDCTIDLEVYDLKHLNAIISQLRAKKVVAAAERVTG